MNDARPPTRVPLPAPARVPAPIRIRPWEAGDLPLLIAANAPAMTVHLGASESAEAVLDRHERYLRGDKGARMFAITRGDVGVGGIGWWPTLWHDEEVYETGWFVLPEGQGAGVGSAAVELTVADVRRHGDRRMLLAFPSVHNAPSNRLCEKAGFALRGVEDFPFRGVVLEVNAWALTL